MHTWFDWYMFALLQDIYPKNTKSQGVHVLPLMVSDRRFIDYSRTEIEAQGDEEGKPFPGTDNLIHVE